MAITQESGPLVVGGRTVTINNYTPDYNPDAAPSPISMGIGVLDPRYRYSDGSGLRALMWGATSMLPAIDFVPAPSSATLLAAAQSGTAGTGLTLATTSTTGLTVLSSAQAVLPTGTTVPSGALALDGVPTTFSYGQSGAIQRYTLNTSAARALLVTWAGNDTAAYLTVSGYDVYGAPMTEKISGASGSTSAGKKAFKFVASAVPGGTVSGSNISLGTQDVFGFPLAARSFAYTDITWNSTAATSSGVTSAVTTTATSVTGDVRGTYAVPSAADGTKNLTVFIAPLPDMSQANLVGVTQA